ncbi:MAG: hypothetical protein LWX09_02640 [Bacteroidia bacterium]|nr:hypothetical protein [Bacteroidia bacterium]
MRIFRTVGKWLMLPVALPVLLLFYAQTAWWHWHRLPNGNLVGHAHPFQAEHSSPIQPHQHSSAQMGFLSQFSTGSATVSDFILFVFGLSLLVFILPVLKPAGAISDAFLNLPSLRAPPSLMFK